MGKKGLNDKQRLFIDYYLEDFNATQSYIKVYGMGKNYNVAKANASRLANSQPVKDEIERRNQEMREKHEKIIDRVVEELARIALSNPTKLVQIIEKEYVDEATGETKTYKGLDYALTKDLKGEEKSTIKGIKPGKNGIEIEQYDKMRAIELLFQYLGIKNKVENTLDGEVTLDFGALKGLTKEEIMEIAKADEDWERKDE
jgi:phage terminase small subunit